MNNDPLFYNDKHELTRYALACGYVQSFELNGHSITLWYEGDNFFHVRYHDHNTHQRIFWDVFDNQLWKARRRYNSACRKVINEQFRANL
jgi:hypothetical protein